MNSMNDKSTTSDNHAACTDANGTDEAPTGAPAAKSQETLESAYEEILPIARALEPKDLILLNLDLSQVAATCVAVGNRMEKHRPFFAALPDFDMASFDGLETAGNALVRAQSKYQFAISPPDSLGRLVSRGTDLRGIMQRAGEAVADAGLVPMEQAITMRGGAGYHDLALALSGWSDVFRAGNLEQIMARSVITEAMLSEASDIVREIIAITGENSLREEKIAEVNDIRRRMFSVCVKRYEDVRRGATFMRWFHDDVDAFTPSLYAKGSRKADVKPAPVATPVVEPNGPVANAPVVKPVVATPVGHPNSSPFIG